MTTGAVSAEWAASAVGSGSAFLDIRPEIGDLEVFLAQASDSLAMILTCPECATGYFVDDSQIRPGGRSVRCAACGARWIAQRDSPLELVASAEEGAFGREPALAAAEHAPLTGDDLPKVFRERANNQQKMREAMVTGLIWGGVAVVLVLIMGAAIVFRQGVVRAMPSTAAAYAAIGLPVNRVGLTIEGVHAEPALQDGHAALSVAMTVRNVADHAVVSPPLSIVLLNAQGKRVGGQIVRSANPLIPPGEQRFFATAILDPPLSAHDLEVSFALDAAGRIPTAKAVRPTVLPPQIAPSLRGATSPEGPAAGNAAVKAPISPGAVAPAPAAAPGSTAPPTPTPTSTPAGAPHG